eukprot:2791170-Rhodomonas_salina.1
MGAQSTPSSHADDPGELTVLEQTGLCSAGVVAGPSWAAGPTTADAATPRDKLTPQEPSTSQGGLAKGRDTMPPVPGTSESRSGDGSSAALPPGGGTDAITLPGTGDCGASSDQGAGSAGSLRLSLTSAEFVPRLRRHSPAELCMITDDAATPQDEPTHPERSPSPGCLAEDGDTTPPLTGTSESRSGDGSSAALPQGGGTGAITLPGIGDCGDSSDQGAGSAESPRLSPTSAAFVPRLRRPSTADLCMNIDELVLDDARPDTAFGPGSLTSVLGNSDHSASLTQGQPVPVTVFRSGVSPPTDLDRPVARTDAHIPLPGTSGDPPPRMSGTRWHTSTIAQ